MAQTETTEKAPKEKKEKRVGIGEVACKAIRDGKDNEQVLAVVRETFPEAKTSLSSVNWYRNKMRSEGEEVKTVRAIKADTPKAPKKSKASKSKKEEVVDPLG